MKNIAKFLPIETLYNDLTNTSYPIDDCNFIFKVYNLLTVTILTNILFYNHTDIPPLAEIMMV